MSRPHEPQPRPGGSPRPSPDRRADTAPDDGLSGLGGALVSAVAGMVHLVVGKENDVRDTRTTTELGRVVSHIDTQFDCVHRHLADVEQALQGRVADLEASLKATIVGQVMETRRDIGALGQHRAAEAPSATDEVAARALIAAERQLHRVVAAGGDHAEVVRGQQFNLRNTLAQYGFVPLSPAVGAAVDPTRHRVDEVERPTGAPHEHGCVAEVLDVGWERSDGSGVLEFAHVRVFRHVPGAPPEPGREPASASDRESDPGSGSGTAGAPPPERATGDTAASPAGRVEPSEPAGRVEPGEPTGSEPTGSEPTGSEPTGSEPTGSEPTGSEPTGSEPTGSEPTGSEPAEPGSAPVAAPATRTRAGRSDTPSRHLSAEGER